MLFFRSTYFPKQLFFRFVVLQLLGLLPTLFIAAAIARAYLAKNLTEVHTVAETAALFDRTMVGLSLFTVATITGISLWTGYRLVLPLGRILVKARSIQRRDYAAREEEAVAIAEPSEWSDLETTLHKIGREMQRKDRSLSRERSQVETVMSALTEAVAAIDKSGAMLFFNSQFAILFGPGQGGAHDQRLSEFIRSPDVIEAFRETLKDGTPRRIGTKLRLKEERGVRYFAISVAPLRQENDDLYGAIGVFHDLTELRHLDQVRIDFVANVSHELRTPLTAIKGYAQTLKEDLPETNPSRKFLETIERNTDRLIALVHDLLNLSSLESGAEIEREEISLPELTARVLGQLEGLRAEKRQEITVNVNVPTLCADPKRVEQILFNLLENAVKYVPAGGHIEVLWRATEESVELHVSDDGPGIPPEHRSRVFERFYRVDGARSRDQGGTGLGLSIVKHIMQRHGGSVAVRGENQGRGAHFICTFPPWPGRLMFFARESFPFPSDLSVALEKTLARGDAKRRGAALRQLWSKLAKGRGQTKGGEKHYSFLRDEADAYAAYYLPANCLKAALVMEESFLAGIDPFPTGEARWLDLGTGPGTAFWGLAWWCARRGKKLRFTGWDQSSQFTGIARELAGAQPFRAQADFLTEGADPVSLIRRLKPTHVSFVNSLAEIYPDPAARLGEVGKILRALRELEKQDGQPRFLLLLEPGSRDSSRELARLKDELQGEKLGAVLFPCLDARPCGALANPQDWCHEEVACEFPDWLNELGAAAGMRKESMLFSYAWIAAGEKTSPLPPGGMRMVSQRMERKGQVECRLCTSGGKRMVRVQRSKAAENVKTFFLTARGDLWSAAEIGDKGDLASLEPMFPTVAKTVFS